VPIDWEDSTTYQMILKKGVAQGALQGARAALLAVGAARCGQPPADTEAAVNAISDIERLRRMMRTAANATTWAEVMATP
jgi:hypothetical protein